MTAQVEKEDGVALTDRWEHVSQKIQQLAEEIPAEKFEWRPVAGVRSSGDILRHVAFWNEYLADSLREKQPGDAANELAASDYPTKTSIMYALNRSSQDVGTALRTEHAVTDQKKAELVVTFLEHTSEHYGQLSVYARLLNIVPPASR